MGNDNYCKKIKKECPFWCKICADCPLRAIEGFKTTTHSRINKELINL